jgi:D-amino-acid oxidase
MNVLVIGGGVIGLTTALLLHEKGHQVTVVARDWAPHIVSSVAAAIWHPYQVSHPSATLWAMQTAERLIALYDVPGAGIRPVLGCEYHRHTAPTPDWAGALRFHEPIPASELPPVEGIVAGYRFEVPLIETPIYMQWLRDRALSEGIALQTQTVTSLDEIAPEYDLVVNCTGLGAVELAGDTTMYPIRGQIVKVEPGHVDRFLFDEENPVQPVYIIPRTDGTILGGTALHQDWDMGVRDDTTASILNYAATLHPALKEAPVLDILVGLRPGRNEVRLEREIRNGRTIIHNYGHGGSGYTLSWGCAGAVAELATDL